MTGATTISHAGLAASLLAPWLAGGLMLHLLLPRGFAGRLAICAGCGYLAGLLLTVILLRVFNLLAPGHLYVPTLTVLLAAALTMAVVSHRRGWKSAFRDQRLRLSKLEKALALLFLGLIALRLGTLVQEVAIRPLFPWDALMNWAPKAVVWSHYNELVPFTTAEQWLASDHATALYTLRAAVYPEMVPLILLWNMLGANVSDHSLLYLSWPLLLFCLAMATYGFSRSFALQPVPSLLAAYLVCSLPFANVHTALAGYADLWMATAFMFAVCSAQALVNTRNLRFLALTLPICLACVMLKRPGLVLAGIVILTLVACWFRTGPRILLGGVVILLILLFIGIDFTAPLLGRVSLSTSFVSLPVIGEIAIEYHDVSARFMESFFLTANWNILAYLAVAAMILAIFQPRIWQHMGVTGLGLLLAMVFLYVTYNFSYHYKNAEDFTALNRALLYVMPLLVIFCALVADQTAKRLAPAPVNQRGDTPATQAQAVQDD